MTTALRWEQALQAAAAKDLLFILTAVTASAQS